MSISNLTNAPWLDIIVGNITCEELTANDGVQFDNLQLNNLTVNESLAVSGNIEIASNANPWTNLTPSNGQVLGFANGSLEWVNNGGGGGTTQITEGSNITVSYADPIYTISLDNNQTLTGGTILLTDPENDNSVNINYDSINVNNLNEGVLTSKCQILGDSISLQNSEGQIYAAMSINGSSLHNLNIVDQNYNTLYTFPSTTGANAQILKLAGTNLEWADESGGGGGGTISEITSTSTINVSNPYGPTTTIEVLNPLPSVVGANGDYLSVQNGVPTWIPPITNGIIHISSNTLGIGGNNADTTIELPYALPPIVESGKYLTSSEINTLVFSDGPPNMTITTTNDNLSKNEISQNNWEIGLNSNISNLTEITVGSNPDSAQVQISSTGINIQSTASNTIEIISNIVISNGSTSGETTQLDHNNIYAETSQAQFIQITNPMKVPQYQLPTNAPPGSNYAIVSDGGINTTWTELSNQTLTSTDLDIQQTPTGHTVNFTNTSTMGTLNLTTGNVQNLNVVNGSNTILYTMPTSAPAVANEVLLYNGTGLVWAQESGSGTITNITSTANLSVLDGSGPVVHLDIGNQLDFNTGDTNSNLNDQHVVFNNVPDRATGEMNAGQVNISSINSDSTNYKRVMISDTEIQITTAGSDQVPTNTGTLSANSLLISDASGSYTEIGSDTITCSNYVVVDSSQNILYELPNTTPSNNQIMKYTGSGVYWVDDPSITVIQRSGSFTMSFLTPGAGTSPNLTWYLSGIAPNYSLSIDVSAFGQLRNTGSPTYELYGELVGANEGNLITRDQLLGKVNINFLGIAVNPTFEYSIEGWAYVQPSQDNLEFYIQLGNAPIITASGITGQHYFEFGPNALYDISNIYNFIGTSPYSVITFPLNGQ